MRVLLHGELCRYDGMEWKGADVKTLVLAVVVLFGATTVPAQSPVPSSSKTRLKMTDFM